ncbi:MAG: 30S ribosomal protein S17, partial [Candidatus Methanomethylophilaceae archaeon]|nr:30S ribosomal protein S17 [Candidatus Methanomethylophilaceae archaeon]
AHASPCLGLKVGDKVTIAECRPLAKTETFVVIDKKE